MSLIREESLDAFPTSH